MKGKNLIWGLFFIGAAIAVILSKADLLGSVSLFSVVVALLLMPIIIKSLRHLNFFGIFVPLSLIAILFDDVLGIEKFTPWPVIGSALLLSAGLSLIFPYRYRITKNGWSAGMKDHFKWDSSSADGEVVNISSSFSGCEKYITSQVLKEVNIRCKCAGVEVYFDNADLAGDTAVINLDVTAGGVELYIPKSWNVKNEADCVIGGVDISSKKDIVNGKTLILRGRVSAAGVDITYI